MGFFEAPRDLDDEITSSNFCSKLTRLLFCAGFTDGKMSPREAAGLRVAGCGGDGSLQSEISPPWAPPLGHTRPVPAHGRPRPVLFIFGHVLGRRTDTLPL